MMAVKSLCVVGRQQIGRYLLESCVSALLGLSVVVPAVSHKGAVSSPEIILLKAAR